MASRLRRRNASQPRRFSSYDERFKIRRSRLTVLDAGRCRWALDRYLARARLKALSEGGKSETLAALVLIFHFMDR